MLDLGKLRIGIEVDSAGAKNQLNSFSGEVDKTESKIGGKMKGLAGKVGKAFIAATAAAAAAVGAATVKITKDALKAYASFEQLEGGVKKIFGDSAQTVMNNAQEAFRTAGMSANEYMEQVTSFSASLIQSVGGDTEKAAKIADMAIKDMSDNANTFGTDIQSIQNAYQGFAKQNYTMLDNLKLGYGGTKSEMERLLADAEKLTGQKYDISNLDDVYNAIHAVQEEMSITGTTANEAMNTIEGSVNATKAAWQNFLVGLGDEDADLDALVNNLVTSAKAAMGNIVPRVGQILSSLWSVIQNQLLDKVNQLPDLIGSGMGDFTGKLSSLLSTVFSTLSSIDFGAAIKTLSSSLFSALSGLISTLATGLSSIDFGSIAKSIGSGLASALGQALKFAISTVTTLLPQVGAMLVSAVSGLADFVVKGLNSIADSLSSGGGGLLSSLASTLLSTAWGVAKALVAALPGIIAGIVKVAIALLKAQFSALGKMLGSFLPPLFSKAWDKVKSACGKAINSVKSEITKKWDDIKSAVADKWNSLKEAVKSKLTPNFDFHPIETFKSVLESARAKWSAFKGWLKSKAKAAFDMSPFKKFVDFIKRVQKAWQNLKSKLHSKANPSFNFGPFSTLKGWIDRAKGWWDSLRSKLSKSITGHVSTSGGGTGGTVKKRVGLREVPYDGYLAELHKGEAVLTAAEANQYNKAINKIIDLDAKPKEAAPITSEKTINYSFGNITVDVSKLKDLTTVEEFVDMMVRAKQFA